MVGNIEKGLKLTSREPYWDYMGRRLREADMTDLINPSEYTEKNVVTMDTISDKILTMRKQLLELENELKKYINQKENDLKQIEMDL